MTYFIHPIENLFEFIVGFFLLLSSLGVVTLKKPVHASLSFLLTLLLLAVLYVELSAEFIGIMQVLVYAGAILVIFMFVVVLFQNAHEKIALYQSKTNQWLILSAIVVFFAAVGLFVIKAGSLINEAGDLKKGYGTALSLGEAMYIDFFFPFEVVVFLFLTAMIGSLYIGKKNDTH